MMDNIRSYQFIFWGEIYDGFRNLNTYHVHDSRRALHDNGKYFDIHLEIDNEGHLRT